MILEEYSNTMYKWWIEEENYFIRQLLHAGYINLSECSITVSRNEEANVSTKRITTVNNKWSFTYNCPTLSTQQFSFSLWYKNNKQLPYLFTEDTLAKYFTDWLNPTPEEITMFELNYGFEWIFGVNECQK